MVGLSARTRQVISADSATAGGRCVAWPSTSRTPSGNASDAVTSRAAWPPTFVSRATSVASRPAQVQGVIQVELRDADLGRSGRAISQLHPANRRFVPRRVSRPQHEADNLPLPRWLSVELHGIYVELPVGDHGKHVCTQPRLSADEPAQFGPLPGVDLHHHRDAIQLSGVGLDPRRNDLGPLGRRCAARKLTPSAVVDSSVPSPARQPSERPAWLNVQSGATGLRAWRTQASAGLSARRAVLLSNGSHAQPIDEQIAVVLARAVVVDIGHTDGVRAAGQPQGRRDADIGVLTVTLDVKGMAAGRPLRRSRRPSADRVPWSAD